MAKITTKKIYFFIVLFFFSLFFYGQITNFMPFFDTTKYLFFLYIFIALILVLPLFIIDLEAEGSVIRKRNFIGQVFTFLFFMLMGIGLGWGVMRTTIPSIYTSLMGSEYTSITSVKNMRHSYNFSSTGCKHSLTTNNLHGRLCINKNLYNVLNIGDIIRLQGKVSKYGVKIDRIEKSNANNTFNRDALVHAR